MVKSYPMQIFYKSCLNSRNKHSKLNLKRKHERNHIYRDSNHIINRNRRIRRLCGKEVVVSDNEWVLAEERIPNVFSGKFQVRLQNGDEINAFFIKMPWRGSLSMVKRLAIGGMLNIHMNLFLM